MAFESMCSLLSTLLEECLVSGTSARDAGVTVSMDKLAGEKVFFYKIDGREGREKLKMIGEGIKICDHLVVYGKENERKEVVCYIEIKGKNVALAKEQILETHKHVKPLAKEEIAKESYQQLVWKVCICLHGSAPQRNQRLEDELIKTFGKENIRIKRDVMLGDFLRR